MTFRNSLRFSSALFMVFTASLTGCGLVAIDESKGGNGGAPSTTTSSGGSGGTASTTSSGGTGGGTGGGMNVASLKACDSLVEGYPPPYEPKSASMSVAETVFPYDMKMDRWINVNGTCYHQLADGSDMVGFVAPGTTVFYWVEGSSNPKEQINFQPQYQGEAGGIVQAVQWYYYCPGTDAADAALTSVNSWQEKLDVKIEFAHYTVSGSLCDPNGPYYVAAVLPDIK